MNGLQQLALLVLITLAAVGLLAMRRKVFARMALRNIARRKRFAVIIVSGLLVATAMISGALVVGDTLDYLIKKSVFDSTGNVDIVVSVWDDAGQSLYFNESVAYDLVASTKAGNLTYIDGVEPVLTEGATMINPRTSASSPRSLIFGFDPDNIVNPLLDQAGNPVTLGDISGGKVVLNKGLADELEASPGDTLLLMTESGIPFSAEVSLIAKETGMANWNYNNIAFVDLGFAQDVIFNKSGMINGIDVSCKGGIENGYVVSDQAVQELRTNLEPGYEYQFDEIKKDGVESAQTTSDMVSQIFIIMSSFAIIAGIALIINIFVMMAEERKPEMGISRAIGMQRGHLTQTFMFEGVVYALLASIVGAFVGLIVAAVMITLFSTVMGGAGITWALHFEWNSIGIAMCAGFLITAVTVIVASWRVSKLNIVRAIRDIPEPMLAKSEKKYVITGIVGIVLGALLTLAGISSKQAMSIMAGPCLLALGASLVAVRFVSPRIPFTLSGCFMIFWEIDPTDLIGSVFGELSGGMEMFIVSGVVLVTGGVLVVMFNSDLLLDGLMSIFGRGKSLMPVFKVAISYPLNKKFRTGLSLFIFSLIMFTVIVIAMIASFQRESVDATAQKFSGGYDILGMSMRDIPAQNLTVGLAALNSTFGENVMSSVEVARTAPATLIVEGANETRTTTLIGFDGSMLAAGSFSLSQRADEYGSDAEAWEAVAHDPSLVIMDGSVVRQMYGPSYGSFFVEIGQRLTIVYQNGNTTSATVIGIMDQVFLTGAFTSSGFVLENAPTSRENLLYFAISNSASAEHSDIGNELEKIFVEYGLLTYVIRDLVEQYMSTVSSVMQLMEVFLGIGLIVGITGLGIITIRNIAERKQEIGVMRAIGYQRDMVLKVFLLETTFVSLLGITLGVVLGIALSWRLYDWGGFSQNGPFVIPWGEVLMLTTIAFVITLASTLSPSRRASRLAPAEALRKVD
jgi:putative ABC transport system permease protein